MQRWIHPDIKQEVSPANGLEQSKPTPDPPWFQGCLRLLDQCPWITGVCLPPVGLLKSRCALDRPPQGWTPALLTSIRGMLCCWAAVHTEEWGLRESGNGWLPLSLRSTLKQVTFFFLESFSFILKICSMWPHSEEEQMKDSSDPILYFAYEFELQV